MITPSGRFPIVPQVEIRLSPDTRQTMERLSEGVRAESPSFRDLSIFGPLVRTGLPPGPLLAIEDHSGIQLAARIARDVYAYRILLLAGDGDLVVTGRFRSTPFEAYCRETLHLGAPEVLPASGNGYRSGLARAAAHDPVILDRAVVLARSAGRLAILPYMATGWVWRLAQEIAGRAQVPVAVAGPPPWLTRAVNDKLWFARRVSDLLGPSALPESFAAHGMAALVAFLQRLMRRHEAVAVKMTSAASSVGNLILDSRDLRSLDGRKIKDQLLQRFQEENWIVEYPLQATAWEAPPVCSPSVQLWIPEAESGPPVIEAIFDQVLMGRGYRFVGAAPTDLPETWQQRLGEEAMQLALLFQTLGYFGRCSFDAILVGAALDEAELHWVECNGRWGGVSIPMSIMNRLFGDWKRRPFVTVSQAFNGPPGLSVPRFLEAFRGELLRPGDRDVGAVLLAPATLESGQGIDLLVCDHTVEAAQARADRIVGRLAPAGTLAGTA